MPNATLLALEVFALTRDLAHTKRVSAEFSSEQEEGDETPMKKHENEEQHKHVQKGKDEEKKKEDDDEYIEPM